MSTTEFLLDLANLSRTRMRTREDEPLAPGQIRVALELFSLSANNVTYAAFGEAMHYWQFFPSGEDGWGLVPVWGFASVVQSQHPGVAAGERLYGYFPPASHAVLAPDRLSPSRFTDATAHRAALPAVYNQYFRCAQDPLYTPDSEAIQALLRPLFITSWLIDDFLSDNGDFGARDAGGAATVLLSSASSKTAYGTAFQLAQRPNVRVIGLTSQAHRAFCESLGFYARVLSYEQLAQLDAATPCLYVDFAGNGDLRRTIHERFNHLRYSMVIGNTHVDERAEPGSARDLPGPRATFFFAPAQIKKRTGEWGARVFGERLARAWFGFTQRAAAGTPPWLQIQTHHGLDALPALWGQVLGGHGNARVGHVLVLRTDTP